MTNLQSVIGAVIRDERRQRRQTLKDLAERAAISVVYLGEIERGKKYPSPQVLERLAGALDLEVAEVLEFVADELRCDAPPASVNAIGFALPGRAQVVSRTTVKRIVQMLEPDEVATLGELGAFLIARRAGSTAHGDSDGT